MLYNKSTMFRIEEELKKVPGNSGVYLMFDNDSNIIYVGKAINLNKRIRSYFRKSANHTAKIRRMVSSVSYFEYIITDTEMEALILENNLIKQHKPMYNTMLKDDKTYPYIKVTKDRYPRIFLTRDVKIDDGIYFGPYSNSYAAKETIDIVRKLYYVRSCRRNLPKDIGKERPCLYYHVGLCKAPCIGEINEADYSKNMDSAIYFLRGHYDEVIKELRTQMDEASQNMEYEKAAGYRDKINSIKAISSKQKVVSDKFEDIDVIAFAKDEEDSFVQVFFIRNGKMLGKEDFVLNSTDDQEDSQIIKSFMEQYYINCAYIPKEILLQNEVEDEAMIKKWLSNKRGKKVSITVPLKGKKRELVKLAVTNANNMLTLNIQKKTKEYNKTKGALLELEKMIGITGINKIEAYDISNISGVDSVGSMVVFEDGLPSRSNYRKFKIKSVDKIDDYSSLREVLTRRMKRAIKEQKEILENKLNPLAAKFSKLPDVIFMDGGKGQVNIAKAVEKDFGLEIPICGMVKDDKHNTRGLYFEDKILPIDRKSDLFRLIVAVQDEAHRFAFEYHTKLRNKQMVKSVLLNIEGVGDKRRKALLRAFGSVKIISKQKPESLMKVDSISKNVAEKIYEYFNGNKE